MDLRDNALYALSQLKKRGLYEENLKTFDDIWISHFRNFNVQYQSIHSKYVEDEKQQMPKAKYVVLDSVEVSNEKNKKPTSKDYEKIISIQERIIKAKESEFKQIERLFLHYLDKYELYSWWYSKYRLYYDAIVLKSLKTLAMQNLCMS